MSLWTPRIGSSQHRGKHCLSDPPCSCQGSPDILHHPGWSCQTSVFKTEAAIQTWSDASLVIPIWVSPEQNEVTKYLRVSFLWLEATIWPEIPEFEPLSARLHRNSPWVILTSMSLFVLFNWVLWQWVPLPPGYEVLWPPCAKNDSWPRRLILGFQTILADTAHNLARGLLYRLFKAKEPK